MFDYCHISVPTLVAVSAMADTDKIGFGRSLNQSGCPTKRHCMLPCLMHNCSSAIVGRLIEISFAVDKFVCGTRICLPILKTCENMTSCSLGFLHDWLPSK